VSDPTPGYVNKGICNPIRVMGVLLWLLMGTTYAFPKSIPLAKCENRLDPFGRFNAFSLRPAKRLTCPGSHIGNRALSFLAFQLL
jgi:hypothetical protein